jgi:hypothetical protein
LNMLYVLLQCSARDDSSSNRRFDQPHHKSSSQLAGSHNSLLCLGEIPRHNTTLKEPDF